MIALLMSISIVFDISQKIKDFIDNQLGIWEVITGYYIHFVILYSNMFSSLIVFLSVIWFTSLMASRTEIVPILSGGVSFNRFLRPYFIAATILTVYSLFMNHYVVPYSNKKQIEFTSRNTGFMPTKRNTFLEVQKGVLVYFDQLDIRSFDVQHLWVENWKQNDNGEWKLQSSIQARQAIGDSTKNTWQLRNYFIREVKNDREVIRKGTVLDTVLSFKGIDLGQREEAATALITEELNKYRKKEIEKGSENVIGIDLERYQRSALPFATYILTLIGVAVSSRKTRGGIGLNIALGLSATMIYIFFQRMGQVAAVNSGLHPIVAVWLPNIIFGVIAYLFYKKAPK